MLSYLLSIFVCDDKNLLFSFWDPTTWKYICHIAVCHKALSPNIFLKTYRQIFNSLLCINSFGLHKKNIKIEGKQHLIFPDSRMEDFEEHKAVGFRYHAFNLNIVLPETMTLFR